MATQFTTKEEVTRGAGTYNIPPEEIIANYDKNCRYAEESEQATEFQELLESIRQSGQRIPGEVRKDAGKPVLVSGHRRLRALKIVNEERKSAGLEPFPFVALYVNLSAEDAFDATIQENLGRKNLGVMDLAKTCGVYANLYKKSPGEIARKLGKSESTVNKYLSVITLSRGLQNKCHREGWSADVAFKIAALPEAERDEALTTIEGVGKITGPAVVAEARKRGVLSGKTQRKMGEMKSFLASVQEEPTNSVYVKRLAKALTEWIVDGKDDAGLIHAFDRNCRDGKEK